jgi:quaternary ammonium compound-resistance protein SugE
MAWVILVLAGILEIGLGCGLKYMEDFTRLWPSVATISGMAVSLALLGVAARIAIAHRVWRMDGDWHSGDCVCGVMLLFGEAAGCASLVRVSNPLRNPRFEACHATLTSPHLPSPTG